MSKKKVSTSGAVAALLGDVVGSRTTSDRAALHDRLGQVLTEVDEIVAPMVPLRITVGDEYQGVFATVGEASHAALLIRLALLPAVDVRQGIGWGTVAVLSSAGQPRVEDGPGWWAAREAIESVKSDASGAGLRLARTSYRRADESLDGADPSLATAALMLRDQQIGALDERSLGVLRGLLGGMSQKDIAERLGITASAVSQRVRADGLAMLVRAERAMEAVR